MAMLSVAYFTNRLDPKIQWFIDSLNNQRNQEIDLVVIDFHHGKRPLPLPDWARHHPPKPSIWQGEHRVTKQNWFDAANARNTAICLAKGEHIAFVDDLSVLLPGWFECVLQSTRENYIALGAYKKVKKLVVENGHIKSFEPYPPGEDSRLHWAKDDQTSCGGSILYGCSLCMPIEAGLVVNGFPEDLCGGLGFEDVCFGIAVGNTNKFSFRYDRRMMTYESEEDHGVGEVFKKTDKGLSPNDKSHAALNTARGSKWFPNQFNLREMRDAVQRGEPFPIFKSPVHDWYDKQPIAEFYKE